MATSIASRAKRIPSLGESAIGSTINRVVESEENTVSDCSSLFDRIVEICLLSLFAVIWSAIAGAGVFLIAMLVNAFKSKK